MLRFVLPALLALWAALPCPAAADDWDAVVAAARKDGYLEVSVSDHGVGISKREQGRIFDRFYRSGQTSSKATGAGLGLALVKHFATSHGGDVSVSSAPGKGSRTLGGSKSCRACLPNAAIS